jgi:hypothetical protein
MKKVLSISLGSSIRDHRVETNILGEKFIIERRGTNGDKKEAARLFKELDGKYDAFGLGGIDLYIYSRGKRYTFLDAKKIIKNVNKTPVVDGSGLKNTLERKVINYINDDLGILLKGKKVLMVSAVDRFGMAEAFVENGAEIIFGDLIFGLGIPLPLHSIYSLHRIARVVAPIITKMPFEMFYPTGDKQNNSSSKGKYSNYYLNADIIAGDFLYIKRYMPDKLRDKIIVTNTVTTLDIKELEKREIKMLITTTPELETRSFGTNVMEAVLITLAAKKPEELSSIDYLELLDKIGFKPRVIKFDHKAAS